MTADPTPATGERTTSEPPECREEHGAAFYDGTRPVGATGTHGTTGRRCRWDGESWRIEAWDELHYTVMCALFEAYKAPDQHHGARGEKAGWSPDEIVTEHMRRYIARLPERTTSETTGAGLRERVAALADGWASASSERSTITRWAAASRLRRALLAETPAEDEGAVKAAALREAAEDIETELSGTDATGYYAADHDSGYREAQRHAAAWLRDRADRMGTGQ